VKGGYDTVMAPEAAATSDAEPESADPNAADPTVVEANTDADADADAGRPDADMAAPERAEAE
jgi:hypothetical protein